MKMPMIQTLSFNCFIPLDSMYSICKMWCGRRGGGLLLSTQPRLLTTLKKKPFENNVGNGENAGNQHFLLFPQCFLPIPKRISVFKLYLLCLCKCFHFGPILFG